MGVFIDFNQIFKLQNFFQKSTLKVSFLFSYLSTNLVTALAGLDMYDFPHSGCESLTETESSIAKRTSSGPLTGFKELDKAFIMLERFQDGAGTGRWARLAVQPAAVARGLDEGAHPGWGLRRGAAVHQGREIR